MRRPRTTRYTLIKGQYSIHNPDNPRRGPQPDGDTITFIPDALDLIRGLRRFSGTAPDIRNGHINVRYEAIDALETHFNGAHQDLTFANAARDRNLALLGFTNVQFFSDLPNVVQSVDRNPLPGYVLANGIESNGRLLGLVFGLAGSLVLIKLIGSSVFGFTATVSDLRIYLYVALLLAGVALIACALPAWRATRIDPSTALRAE